MSDDEHTGQYYIEFVSAGKSVKVTAIDPHTGREVSIVGAAKATRKQLSELAVRKLKYVLAKEKE
jgi:hypothetical protein